MYGGAGKDMLSGDSGKGTTSSHVSVFLPLPPAAARPFSSRACTRSASPLLHSTDTLYGGLGKDTLRGDSGPGKALGCDPAGSACPFSSSF